MSRTYRRKGVKAEKGWGDFRYLESRGVKCSFWWWEADRTEDFVPDKEHYLKYCEARYHSDTRVGFGWKGNAPASYRRCLTRSEKSKDKAETRRILKQGDYEEYEYTPWKKDAGYHYW